MQDFWTSMVIKECLKTLFYSHWQEEEFHSIIMEVSKLMQEVMIHKTENLFGKIWILIQTFTNSLKQLIKLERIKKSGIIQWMKNMS